MREAFAHDALLGMAPDADVRAPGAAITIALCGSVEHEGPCPLASHHTSARRDGDGVHLRILFAAAPADEDAVRERIDAALAAGGLDATRWTLRASGAGAVAHAEAAHAERLRAG